MEQITHCGALVETPKTRAAQTWRPAPAIRVSAALHLSGLAGVLIDPASWAYIGVALAGNHVALGLAGMWPRSTWLGTNLRRLPADAVSRREFALTFDDGPDPAVTLRVLDLLDLHEAKASFFCIGKRAETYRDIVQEIARRGHSVENHSHRHPGAFAVYGIRRLRREIEAAQDTLATLTGRAPAFFRPPIGLRNPLLYPVLARLGLTHVSWTRRGFDTVDSNPLAVSKRLHRNLAAGDILAMHDRSATRAPGERPVILTVLPALIARANTAKLKSVTLSAACRA